MNELPSNIKKNIHYSLHTTPTPYQIPDLLTTNTVLPPLSRAASGHCNQSLLPQWISFSLSLSSLASRLIPAASSSRKFSTGQSS